MEDLQYEVISGLSWSLQLQPVIKEMDNNVSIHFVKANDQLLKWRLHVQVHLLKPSSVSQLILIPINMFQE